MVLLQSEPWLREKCGCSVVEGAYNFKIYCVLGTGPNPAVKRAAFRLHKTMAKSGLVS